MIYGAIHYIKQVLGKDHPIVQKLEEIKLEDGYRVVRSSEFSGRAVNTLGPLHALEKILIDPDDASLDKNPDLKSQGFWSLVDTLVHEAAHLGYKVGDPEAGRLTAQILHQFLPVSPPQKQPLPSFENYSCDNLKTIRASIRNLILFEMDAASLIHSSGFNSPGLSFFEDAVSTYRHQIAEIEEDEALKPSQKTQRMNSIRDRARREMLELMHHWGGRYRFQCPSAQVDPLANAEDLHETLAGILRQTIQGELDAEFSCDPTTHPKR